VIEVRIAKVVMVGSLAVFAFIVAFDNVTDYVTNFEFVRHVLSMDTTFPENALLYRRITVPALWNLAYWLIILGEGLTSLSLALAAIGLMRRLRSNGAEFDRALRFYRLRDRFLGVVFWFYGRCWRVVRNVGIAVMEWPRGGVSLLHDDPGRPDFCKPDRP
jgi:predicted small integral membrane protein